MTVPACMNINLESLMMLFDFMMRLWREIWIECVGLKWVDELLLGWSYQDCKHQLQSLRVFFFSSNEKNIKKQNYSSKKILIIQ